MDRADGISVSAKRQNDFVTNVDRQAEATILEILKASFPDHGYLGEETGQTAPDSIYQWVIDPLDGTTNFIHGFPQFAVSIALLINGKPEVGVIYDPMRQELFTASKGSGARLDDRKIRVSNTRELQYALVGTGVPYSNFEYLDDYLRMMRSVVTQCSGIRRPGAASLDLAWLAAGRIDAFWELQLKPRDFAAGALMVTEAGGVISDINGSPLDILNRGNIIAGNPKTCSGLMKAVGPYVPQELR
jgi:myo-inositol-1(or 4)-monophosphatase